MTTLGKAGLAYARVGYAVFPCEQRRKKSLTDHRFEDAAVDESQIRGWRTGRRLGSIPIPAGAVSGVVMLEIDPAGVASPVNLEGQHSSPPEKRGVKTRRDGSLGFKHLGLRAQRSVNSLGRNPTFFPLRTSSTTFLSRVAA